MKQSLARLNRALFSAQSEHLALLEDLEDQGEGDDHHSEDYHPGPWGGGDEVAEGDVHSEEAGDQCRWHEQKGHEGEYLHDLVLVEVDDTEDSVLEVLKTLETEVSVVDQ